MVMMCHDRYGLALSTQSEAAARHYREGIDALLAVWPGAIACFDAALGADPNFALAHAARARGLLIAGHMPQARASIETALQQSCATTERERQHILTIAALVGGPASTARQKALEHVAQFPRDALILSLLLGAFGLIAFSGNPDHDRERLALCQAQARHYGDDWWFLTHLGWSHTEAGLLRDGLTITRRAFELKCENANAAHALSHALFETGAVEDGVSFIEDWLPCYDISGGLNAHLTWHLALFELEQDNPAGALELYRRRIAPAVTHAPAPLNVLTDSASLLWRLLLAGQDDALDHFDEVHRYGAEHFPKPGLAFVDLHQGLIAAATAGMTQDRTRHPNSAPKPAHAPPARDGALDDQLGALRHGLALFATGDYAAAAEAIGPAIATIARIGGSHAQRQICEDTLIVANLRAGRAHIARDLIGARLERRPSRRDAAWLRQANTG